MTNERENSALRKAIVISMLTFSQGYSGHLNFLNPVTNNNLPWLSNSEKINRFLLLFP